MREPPAYCDECADFIGEMDTFRTFVRWPGRIFCEVCGDWLANVTAFEERWPQGFVAIRGHPGG